MVLDIRKNITPELIRKMIMIGLVDALTSQIFIDMFVVNFRISVSVIILPIIYYYNRDVNPIINAFFVGVIGILFRSSLTTISGYGAFQGFIADYNILFFDLTYGICYYFLFYKGKLGDNTLMNWFITIWACDFFANFVEMTTRMGIVGSEFVDLIDQLLLVGLIRAIIGLSLVFLFEYYRLMVQKEKQLEKYKDMLNIVSNLKSEAYFIQSNMNYIEDVMKEAYELYEKLDVENDKLQSLKIAKDIHEVKKNYHRVLVGIEQLGEEDTSKMLKISEILLILKDSYNKDQEFKRKKIKINVYMDFDLEILKHYYMMSVIRNLVNNSVEAFTNEEDKKIDISVNKEGGFVKIAVSDNGPGIKPKNKSFVFRNGYSTKFNKITGDIYRGMGLPIVKDIIEKEFNGSITLKSELYMGTEIIIKIPLSSLGEYHYEILSN